MDSLADLVSAITGTYGNRPDGTRKGKGWFGELRNKYGQPVTELTGEADGMTFPLVNPNQSFKTLNDLLMKDQIDDEAYRAAIEFAIRQGQQGKSPYKVDPWE